MAITLYSEWMARVRRCPVTSYLIVALLPLVPGGGIYYTMSHAVSGDMTQFSSRGMQTISIAGAMAVGILLISTVFRLFNTWRSSHMKNLKNI